MSHHHDNIYNCTFNAEDQDHNYANKEFLPFVFSTGRNLGHTRTFMARRCKTDLGIVFF